MSDRFRLVPEVHLFLLDRHGRVLLLRRCTTDYENGNYSVVAGHVEANEPVTAAAIREAKEELGDIVNAEPDLCDDLSWHSVESLPSNTIPYVKRALGNYQDGTFFDEFGWHEHA